MQRRVTVILALIVLGAIAYALLDSGPRISQKSLLLVDLSGEISERPAVDWLERYTARGIALPTLVLQLEKAQVDTRIAGVLLRIGTLDAGFARSEELREALAELAKVKPVVAWLDIASLNATREFYIASATRQIFLAPGFLGPLAGIAGQYMFLEGFFEKIGVEVETEKIGKYKSAPEMFTATGMSEPAREQANALLDGVFGRIVAGIAQGRKLEEAEVRKRIDTAPGTAKEYVDAGLADGIATRDDVVEMAGFGDLEELELADYVAVDPRGLELRTGPRVAIVFAEGTIAPGGAGINASFTPERIGGAIDDAAEDESIEAIVLRINSGGGSPQASEAILQRVLAAREKKPVVVSMSDAAASGGYYVACGADAIVAQPNTLTGSIGVFFLRPSFGKLLERLDIRSETMARGQLVGLVLPDHALTPPERERMRSLVRDQYELFVGRVASGRKMKSDEVDAVGQGHVWLGSKAEEIKLVDALGGLGRAVEIAKEKAGIPPDVDPERIVLPAAQSLAEELRTWIGSQALSGLTARVERQLPELLDAGLLALDGGPVYLPPFWIRFH